MEIGSHIVRKGAKMTNQKIIAAFGELMLRIAAPDKKRLLQTLPGNLVATYGGGEANVCASLGVLGMPVRYLTALPDNPVASAAIAELRKLNVDVGHIDLQSEGRMGIYFVEHGACQRGSGVWYDRKNSVISELPPEKYDFEKMLSDVAHLHLTGITPALSRNAYKTTLTLAALAKQKGCTISVDLNFRKKLWNWEPGTGKCELAARCMGEILQYADWIIGNEADAADVFGIIPANSDVEKGELDIDSYRSVAAQLAERFPQAKFIAFTLRGSASADWNSWGGMLYDCSFGSVFFAPLDEKGSYQPYEIRDIVDRFGGGDSFCAGLIYALYNEKYSAPATAVNFAVAASCLKHTVEGDYNIVSEKEISALMNGGGSGRVVR